MSNPTNDLEAEYRTTALREMDLALEWKRKMDIANARFCEHIANAEKATALWTDLLAGRTPRLRVVK